LLQEGALLIEALPEEEYANEHIEGAINIPIKQMREDALEEFDKQRPVVVYCHDNQCDISPRAAMLLETYGFRQVFDYVAGKLDWAAAGLRTEGKATEQPLVRDVMRSQVETCESHVSAGEATKDLAEDDACYVIAGDRTVLGRVGRRARRADADRPITDVMSPGPSTYRPDVPIGELVPKMVEAGLQRVPVTNPEGRLLGILERSDAEQALHEWHNGSLKKAV
jgi:rhodanese-related sulfurtransferase